MPAFLSKVFLSVLQAGAVVCVILGVITTLLVYRHLSDAVFTPVLAFLLSVNLAVPPLFVGLVTYLLVILLGEDVKETRQQILGFISTRVLQSRRWLVGIVGVMATACTAAIMLITWTTPPAYAVLVARLLGGEQDKFGIVKDQVEKIRKVNQQHADELSLVIQVFEQRSRTNFESNDIVSPAKARVLVRALDTNLDPGWDAHPLRWHALAEAYSLFAQASRRMLKQRGSADSSEVDRLYAKSLELYERVAKSRSPLVTKQLKASAMKNIGNVHYYRGDHGKAYEKWVEANQQSPEFGLWGNVIAALVTLKRYDDAIAEGSRAKLWAEAAGKAALEPSGYSSILVNVAFAHLAKEDYATASQEFSDAVALQDDLLNRLNLAYAWVLGGLNQRAVEYLRTFTPPVDPANQAGVVLSGKDDRCGYLIWALANRDAPASVIAARLRAYIGDARTPQELEAEGRGDLSVLRAQVLEHMKTSRGLCTDFLVLPQTSRLILGR